MITTKKYEINLHKSYDKIHYIYPMHKNTFIFLAHRTNGQDVFVFCKKDGKITFQHKFQDMVDTLAAISNKQAIVLLTRRNCIWKYNIQNGQIVKIPFQFWFQESDQSQIQCFSDSKLICVRQWGGYGDNRMRLSYFKLPIQANSKPISIYESKQNQWTYEYLSRRANNHSMVVWYKPRHDDGICIHLHQLVEDKEGNLIGVFKVIESSNSLTKYYDMKNLEFAINNLWQIRKGQLYILALTGRNDVVKSSERITVVGNYILSIETGSIKQSRNFINRKYLDFQIDQIYLGSYSMFRTFQFNNGREVSSPVYYVNNQNEQIMEEQEWECSYLYKYYVPGYDGRTMLECQHQNHDVHHLEIQIKSMTDLRMLGLHFLMAIYQDFDQDLLKEVVDFIPEMEQLK